MPYYVSIKAYKRTVQDQILHCSFKALWACRWHTYIEGVERIRGEGSAGREEEEEEDGEIGVLAISRMSL